MTELLNFLSPIRDFAAKPAPFQIETFAWYLHEVCGKERIQTADLARCFDNAHLPRPANVGASVAKLCSKKPARMLKDGLGYRLAAPARNEIADILPARSSAVKATHLLSSLLNKLTDVRQRSFLNETLLCFQAGAYRACIVMAWNLAYSSLLERIISSGLAAFNSQINTHGFKVPIVKYEDFAELKEGQVLSISRAAKIIGKESAKTLEEKLGKRNTAAHPSNSTVSSVTAEEVIFDLVENIVLKPVL